MLKSVYEPTHPHTAKHCLPLFLALSRPKHYHSHRAALFITAHPMDSFTALTPEDINLCVETTLLRMEGSEAGAFVDYEREGDPSNSRGGYCVVS
ncbi:hypothetical protein CYLTODRAFT_31403 [Cylindrobasidium torrendii FP15055 ss-10]|uniref:Uncharacterized protein n=1 Tax=Cylindrobasidium torrendii FP15055 ss-10 TaxID=1314674 RepID=A0A0D7BAG2_9AGAR|nr:hypothetical protein CYLTODRAFT_31403 [Cylindrobasidium torrendii FP15055 ss-10]